MAAKRTRSPAPKDAPSPSPDSTTPSPFTGFADTEGTFFRKLAKNQSREWFLEHKAEYEEGWAKPLAALLGEVRARIDEAYPDVDLAEPKVFRIHRDVRFSADKTPYKTHTAGVILARLGRAVMEAPAALYLQVGAEEEPFAAAGFYVMPKEALGAYRAALLDDGRGAELASLVKGLEKKRFTVGAGEETKRVPAGVDPAHPRAELLRKKGLIATFPALDRELLVSPRLVQKLAEQARSVAPLVRWLVHETSR